MLEETESVVPILGLFEMSHPALIKAGRVPLLKAKDQVLEE
jgi:hypothetical protein